MNVLCSSTQLYGHKVNIHIHTFHITVKCPPELIAKVNTLKASRGHFTSEFFLSRQTRNNLFPGVFFF